MALADEIRSVLSDPMNLPQDFLDGMVQFQAQNQLPIKTLHTPIFDVRDYGAVGDGVTDDTVAIQSAAKAVSASGGILAFAEGKTYSLATTINITGSNVTVRGNQATLKLSASFVRGSQGQGHFFVTGQSDITFEGIRFDGNSGTLAPDATNNFVIWVTNTPRVTIRNCYATNVNSGGSNANGVFLWVGTSNYAKAIGNTIENVSGGALFFQGSDSVAMGNSCVACDDVGIVFNGINCHNSTAIGNVIDGIPAQCAFGVENGTSHWAIIGNAIRGCFGALDINDAGYAGITRVGGVFAHNIVTDLDKGASSQTFTCGVLYRTTKVRDVKIVSNIFSGLTAYGATDAFVFVSSGTVDRLEITHNILESNNTSIPAGIIFASAGAAISRLKITENRIWSTGATGFGSGIWFANSPTIDTTEISRNTFENSTNGIRFDTPTVNALTLRDNEALSGVTNLYLNSAWGTLSPDVPHLLTKPHGTALFGNEIGYDQITSSVNVASTTSVTPTTIIAGSAHTFDGSNVIAEFFAPIVLTPSVAGTMVQIGLYESGSLVALLGQILTPAAANMRVPVLVRQRFTPSSGSHTYSIGAWATSVTGTPQVGAGVGTAGAFPPAYLRFTKI